jgi:ATP-dependent Clp protease protease subunit
MLAIRAAVCANLYQPLGGFQGPASDMLIHAEEMQKTKHRMTQLYAEHCSRTYEEFEQAMDRRFITAEALEWASLTAFCRFG